MLSCEAINQLADRVGGILCELKIENCWTDCLDPLNWINIGKLAKKLEKFNPGKVANRTPNEAGVVREFVTKEDQTFFRVFSGENSVGGCVTAVKPKSSAYAQEALALPKANRAEMVQEVIVPAGTKVTRSRAAPIQANETFPNRRCGAEQFEIIDRIPTGNFGPGTPLQ